MKKVWKRSSVKNRFIFLQTVDNFSTIQVERKEDFFRVLWKKLHPLSLFGNFISIFFSRENPQNSSHRVQVLILLIKSRPVLACFLYIEVEVLQLFPLVSFQVLVARLIPFFIPSHMNIKWRVLVGIIEKSFHRFVYICNLHVFAKLYGISCCLPKGL